MQQGCLQVVHMDLFVDDIHSEFVRLSIRETWLDPTSCHPDGEGIGVMVSSPAGPVIQVAL